MVDRSMGYEKDHVKARAPIVVGVILAITVIASFIVCLYFFEGLMDWSKDKDEDIFIMHAARELPPAPRLETKPGLALGIQRAKEDARLETYGRTMDESRVRIPIDRALDYFIKSVSNVRADPPEAESKGDKTNESVTPDPQGASGK